jgi:hypothetical protein
MVFDKEDQGRVNSWLEELRQVREEVEQTNFNDVSDYCVARREDTIKLFLEMSKFIEDNLDIFYNPDWKWVQSNKCAHARMNEYNSVLGYSSSPKTISIWIPMGIKFFYNLEQKRVLWITHERNVENVRDTGPDMERVKYKFFHFWDGGTCPSIGYEKYAKTPAFENYFGELPESPFGYFTLKDWVDEDWKNANICKTCLKEAISSILCQDKETLDHIVGMKADIKMARNKEGF